MNLGQRIYQLRTRQNMSQSDLAEALEVSRQSVSKWETNSSVPEIGTLILMAKLFSLSLDELVCGTECAVPLPTAQAAEEHLPAQQHRTPTHRMVGILLLVAAAVVLLILAAMGGPLEGLILASPFLSTGLICVFVRRYAGLWCGWVLYLLLHLYFRYANGVQVWWIFSPWIYQSRYEFYIITTWCMALGLALLLAFTARFFVKIIARGL